MVYTTQYASLLGAITLACDDTAIIGLWFDGQKYFGMCLSASCSWAQDAATALARRMKI